MNEYLKSVKMDYVYSICPPSNTNDFSAAFLKHLTPDENTELVTLWECE